ncbi:hypothetical protein ACLOJK_039065 [Asimina triloba]
MDHHKGHTKRFLLRPHLTIHFLQNLLLPFSSSTKPGSVDPGRSSCWPPSPSSASTPTSQHAATATASPAPTADVAAHALATASVRCPCCPRSCCPLPDATASFARCQHDATASLARCQLPAIPHVGKVGVGVSSPQRTTTMPTSHAAAATVTAQLQCPIRVAYK